MYANLTEILRVSKPVLAKHGLAVVQMPGMQDGNATLKNVLLHESGEWLSGTAAAPLATKETKEGRKPADAQSMGSAITYLRRYSLAAMLGFTQEDDDGNAVSHAPPAQHTRAEASAGDDMIDCPKCGGEMWDNRRDKKNPKGPDLKCMSKECGNAIWLTSWRDDALKELAAAHDVEAIDAMQRSRAEDAVKTLVPAKILAVTAWLDDLANEAGV